MLIEKNMYCFYILKKASNMTWLTKWYSDNVFSDQLVVCKCFTVFPLPQQTPHVEKAESRFL